MSNIINIYNKNKESLINIIIFNITYFRKHGCVKSFV